MERLDIQQRLHNTLGIMLIDKQGIREHATLKDLALEDSEIETLLDQLEFEFAIVFAPRTRNRIYKAPELLTLQILANIVLLLIEND